MLAAEAGLLRCFCIRKGEEDDDDIADPGLGKGTPPGPILLPPAPLSSAHSDDRCPRPPSTPFIPHPFPVVLAGLNSTLQGKRRTAQNVV